jgi:hypothetical protein
VVSQTAVSCHLPKAPVLYPLRRSISANGATELGISPVAPGRPVAISVMKAMLRVWWLRPLLRATRVGEGLGMRDRKPTRTAAMVRGP